jgi:hypothetical protein
MSIRLMTAAWSVRLPDSEKLVLLALADCANDDGLCWPSMASLVAKCSKSDRTIQACIKALVAKDHIERDERPGKGCYYTVHPRSERTPEAASPPKRLPKTPEAASDKPSRTTRLPQKATPSSGKRATRFPANFIPVMTGKTLLTVNGWPPGRLEDELEHFSDHHIAKGALSFDWQASWRTWVKNSKRWEPRNVHRPANDRPSGPISPMVAAGIAREARFAGEQ